MCRGRGGGFGTLCKTLVECIVSYLGRRNPPPLILLLPLLVVDEVVKDRGGVLEHVQGLQHHPALVRENLLHNPSIVNQLVEAHYPLKLRIQLSSRIHRSLTVMLCKC